MLKKVKNQKGFTLIELIVVIAILGILALIAIPRLSGFTRSAKVSADYSTATTIGHAAAAYAAEKDISSGTITVANLQDAKYLPETVKGPQSNGAGSWTIDFNGTGGDLEVKAGNDVFYPKAQ